MNTSASKIEQYAEIHAVSLIKAVYRQTCGNYEKLLKLENTLCELFTSVDDKLFLATLKLTFQAYRRTFPKKVEELTDDCYDFAYYNECFIYCFSDYIWELGSQGKRYIFDLGRD